uniref:Uncharacterized protein n=1 Tax=Sphenodon punctatus TaxID=8508 RepID=A0A8D0GCA0_SPHPU
MELDEDQEGSSPSSDKEPVALKQRLVKKFKAEPGTKKQSTLPFKPVKKEKKRNRWSDSESESGSDDLDINNEVAPRTNVPRRQAAAKATYVLDSESDLDLDAKPQPDKDSDENASLSEGSFSGMLALKPKAAPKRAKGKVAKEDPKPQEVQSVISIQVQDFDEEAKRAAPAPSVTFALSKPAKPAPKKQAASKKATNAAKGKAAFGYEG